MSRGASLLGGIAIVWTIAVVVAALLATAAAWPLALFVGGDPVAARTIAFVVAMLVMGAWAVRTTRDLVVAHHRERAAFRAPWPAEMRGAELPSLRLLDRRGQPGPAAAIGDDLVAELRDGDRSQRAFVLAHPATVHLVAAGPADGSAVINDVEHAEHLRAACGAPPARTQLEPGTYRAVIERAGNRTGRRAWVHAWWICTTHDEEAR